MDLSVWSCVSFLTLSINTRTQCAFYSYLRRALSVIISSFFFLLLLKEEETQQSISKMIAANANAQIKYKNNENKQNIDDIVDD